MKRSFRVLGVLALVAGLALTGCKKDIETSDLTLDLTKKATVTAYFYAETDNQTQGLEFAETGTKVVVSIPNSAFNPAATGNWTDTAAIADGKITVSIPATNAGVTVTFYPAEFIKEQTQAFGSNTASIKKIFKLTAGTTVTAVKPGQVRIHQATYTAEAFSNFVEKVDIKIELRAILKVGDPSSLLQSGKIVDVYCTDAGQEFHTTATLQDKGIISVSVPKDKDITIRFEASKDMNTLPDASSKKYRYEKSITAPSASTPVKISVDFGDGTVWE
ncbi:hypothetical protein [Williamwhitmania taraxaci]|uniref:Fimbrillin-like n=1 Tax=Williamwhitmania taraxaci TaxID=1640674 RepID=A0A1G6UHV9_9BACT|nr:hypothetical protein [Williamwhitmania taraxaci]SDD40968.1 hypothetical protein SAMN05216323_11781 [Williamwhitmania taraxaci]